MPRNSHRSKYNRDDRMRLPAHIVLLITGVMLLFVGGGAILVYSALANHFFSPLHTSSSQVQVTASATAGASPTVHASATPNPSPTLAGPSLSSVPNPYPPHTGNLTLNDPLKDNSKGYSWDEGSFGNGGTCSFSGGSYHAGMSLQGHLLACDAEGIRFGNFAYEVQMNILKGDRGGIFFRQIGTQGPYYYFSIKIDGSYELDRYNGNTSSVLQRGASQVIKRGLNQPNLLAVVVQGSSIDLYVNSQSILHSTDSTTSNGLIGVAADATDQPAEVAFSNARVWIL